MVDAEESWVIYPDRKQFKVYRIFGRVTISVVRDVIEFYCLYIDFNNNDNGTEEVMVRTACASLKSAIMAADIIGITLIDVIGGGCPYNVSGGDYDALTERIKSQYIELMKLK